MKQPIHKGITAMVKIKLLDPGVFPICDVGRYERQAVSIGDPVVLPDQHDGVCLSCQQVAALARVVRDEAVDVFVLFVGIHQSRCPFPKCP